jgi:hypothetical protein
MWRMKCYVLLRNKFKKGPYSLEDLAGFKLKTSDLIWKIGQSSSWHNAGELEELKSFFCEEHLMNSNKEDGGDLPTINENQASPAYSMTGTTQLQMKYNNSPVDISYKHDNLLKVNDTYFANAAIKIFGIMAAVLSGLFLLAALSMKNAAYEQALIATEPVSLSATVVPAPSLPEGSVPHHPVDQNIQNALVTELVAVERKDKNDQQEKKYSDDILKKVIITGNDYKTGTTGGIYNLYLTIENNLPQSLKNVKVQVDYLNSVGRLINSQIITIQNIPARSEKSWKMVDAKTGVKVQYKILDIFSNKQKIAFHEA